MIDTFYLESFVLGCMINDSSCCNSAFEINREYFTNNDLIYIYDNIIEILEKNKSVDFSGLAIRKCDPKVLSYCIDESFTTVEFETKLNQLTALYNKRKVLRQIEELKGKIKDNDFDTTDDLVALTEDAIRIESKTKTSMNLKDIYADLFVELEEGNNRKAMHYGIKELDLLTQGVFNNELTVIAARPGMGKTALAICIAINLSKQGFKGLMVSREMGKTQLIRRIIANVLGFNSQNLKKLSSITDMDMKRLVEGADHVTNLPLKVDTECSTIEEIKALVKMLHKKKELDFVIIDYLQLLKSSKNFQSREQEVSYYSRELRLLSQDLNIPVFLLAQLNRAVEQRENKVPLLSDLRESGSIEQDANNVFMLYQSESMEDERKLDIVIRKQREGCLGTATVKYYKPTNLITDMKPF